MSQRFDSHKLTISELQGIIQRSRAQTLAINPDAFKNRGKAGAKPFRVPLDKEEESLLNKLLG